MNLTSVIAALLGYIGTAFLVLSFQCKQEKRLFFCQMMSGLFFVLHYALSGDYTGMAMDGVCFLRSLAMVSPVRFFQSKKMMGIFLVGILLLCALTWDGIFSVFPGIALFVSTVFVYSGNGDKIRRAQLFCTSPSWIVYNVKVASVPGVLCEALDMTSVLVYEIRKRRAEKSKKG